MFALTKANSYRHNLDALGSDVVALMRDLKNAASFAEQTTRIWSAATRDEFARRRAAMPSGCRPRSTCSPMRSLPSSRSSRKRWPTEIDAHRSMATCSGRRATSCAISACSQRAEHGRMEPARNPEPERPVRAADADQGAPGDRKRAPACRGLQRPPAGLGERPDHPGTGRRRHLGIPADGDGDPPRLRGVQGAAGQGRSRRPRQVGIPRQYEPRDPHADERRAGDGGAAGQDRAQSAPAHVHRSDRQIGQRAAHHHQRHPRLLEDQCRPADTRSGAVPARRGGRGRGDADIGAHRREEPRADRACRPAPAALLRRRRRPLPADRHQPARQRRQVHGKGPCADRCLRRRAGRRGAAQHPRRGHRHRHSGRQADERFRKVRAGRFQARRGGTRAPASALPSPPASSI